jgi:hypothetical protein
MKTQLLRTFWFTMGMVAAMAAIVDALLFLLLAMGADSGLLSGLWLGVGTFVVIAWAYAFSLASEKFHGRR